jgi:uncharacterized membrane protein
MADACVTPQYVCDTSVRLGDERGDHHLSVLALRTTSNLAAVEVKDGKAEAAQLGYGGGPFPKTVSLGRLRPRWTGATALSASARLWFLVAVIGQWTFAVYILAFYGGAIVRGDFAKWGKFLMHGFMPGDTVGNIALSAHISLAAVITACGPLQLIPQIRAHAPRFHRWNGRVYLLIVVAASISALYIRWIRNERVPGDLAQHFGVSLDAALIILCAAMALRYARARQFAIHRRWAIRLYLVVSGVWFFRVGLFFWLALNHGPAGFDPNTSQGPFLDFLSFAEYLLPLAVFELYLRAQDRGRRSEQAAMAVGLVVLTLAMGVGIFGASRALWLPNI